MTHPPEQNESHRAPHGNPRRFKFSSKGFMGGAFGLVLIGTNTAGLGRLLDAFGPGPTALFLAQGALTYEPSGWLSQ